MQMFVFHSWQDSEAFNYLMDFHRDEVKGFLDMAQTAAAEACTSGEFNLSDITNEHAVFERLGERLQGFFDEVWRESCSESEDEFFGSLLHHAVTQLDCTTIAAAVYYGVKPHSDPRYVALTDLPDAFPLPPGRIAGDINPEAG